MGPGSSMYHFCLSNLFEEANFYGLEGETGQLPVPRIMEYARDLGVHRNALQRTGEKCDLGNFETLRNWPSKFNINGLKYGTNVPPFYDPGDLPLINNDADIWLNFGINSSLYEKTSPVLQWRNQLMKRVRFAYGNIKTTPKPSTWIVWSRPFARRQPWEHFAVGSFTQPGYDIHRASHGKIHHAIKNGKQR